MASALAGKTFLTMEGIMQLYSEYSGFDPDKIQELSGAVSTRRYFRIWEGSKTFIGTYSPDTRETVAFHTFATHFRSKGLNVPEVLAVSNDLKFYLQTDLGDQRMHELVTSRTTESLDKELLQLYRDAIDQLVKIQLQGHVGLDYSVAVPRSEFDRQSVLWDLNHFKYYFLKPSGLPFDEQELEYSLQKLSEQISSLKMESFMYRDFQTRNIMVWNDTPYFMDFQGGRRGPLQYDLASILFEARARINKSDRETLIRYYIESLKKHSDIDPGEFLNVFYPVALVRVLQAFGTYGLRGKLEKKAVFLQSIPSALANLEFILGKLDASEVPGYLINLLYDLVSASGDYDEIPPAYEDLTVTIISFSYRRPLPDDISGNGGGFVYDCRFLKNPGKCEELKMLNGFDEEVVSFLEEDPEVHSFIESVRKQLEVVIRSYREMGYRNLMISFGCTGGRHRSVYAGRKIAEWCRRITGLRVIEIHRELEKKK